MSILDDAIREHLELKRAHGADESELKRLEDEAFGPPQRPDEVDPLAEAPTEFLTAPAEVVEQAAAEAEAEGRRVPNITDLQEAPPEPQEAEAPEPAFEEQPAGEHEVISEPPAPEPEAEEPITDGVHTTEEREAIADQPTEMFDVQAEIDANAGAEAESPSDEQLLDASTSEEPRLTPVESLPEPEVPEDEDDDEFFSEQRLSDELNQALEAPVTEEEPLPPLPDAPPEPEPAPEPEPPSEPPAPGNHVEEPTAIYNVEGQGEGDFEEPEGESSAEPNVYEPETGSHDDVLEDTPEFLEDTPEDDDLWFEQRPPKDFDFDD